MKRYDQLAHAMNTPSNRLLISSYRQTGITTALVNKAADIDMNENVLYIAPKINDAKYCSDLFKRHHGEYGDNVFFAGSGSIYTKDNETYFRLADKRSQSVNLNNIDHVYIDIIFFSSDYIRIKDMILNLPKSVNVILATSGSNRPDHMKEISDLTENYGYSTMFVHSEFHPMMLSETKKNIGNEMFRQEFKHSLALCAGE